MNETLRSEVCAKVAELCTNLVGGNPLPVILWDAILYGHALATRSILNQPLPQEPVNHDA